MLSVENDATPSAVVAVVVPESVPPPAFVPIAIVTETSFVAIRFPPPSTTSTPTGGPVGVYGWEVIAWPIRAFAGWAVDDEPQRAAPVTAVVRLLRAEVDVEVVARRAVEVVGLLGDRAAHVSVCAVHPAPGASSP